MNTEPDHVGPNACRACEDCGEQFIINAAEQAWFIAKDLRLPKRCRRCRALRRQGKDTRRGDAVTGNRL